MSDSFEARGEFTPDTLPTDVVADESITIVEPTAPNGFALLGLAPELVQACVDLGYTSPTQVQAGLDATRNFISDVWANVKAGVAAGQDLNAVYKATYAALKPKYGHWVIFDHCMPFDVTRCYDEATQYRDPRVWTAERDQQMWATLEG